MEKQIPEKILLQRHGAGEPEAFARLYHQLKSGLLLYLRSLCENQEDALDLLQELMLDLHAKPEKYLAAREFKPYLFRAAFLAAAKHQRGETRRKNRNKSKALYGNSGAWLTPDNESWEVQGVSPVGVENALKSLKAERREAVILHLYEKFNFREIADITGIPLQTAYSRYQCGIEDLKVLLKLQSPK